MIHVGRSHSCRVPIKTCPRFFHFLIDTMPKSRYSHTEFCRHGILLGLTWGMAMLATVKTWLAPPIFPGDETLTRRASLLYAALISGTSFASISLTVDLLAGKAPPVITATNLLLLVLFFLLRAWICQGKIQLTSLFLLSIGFIHITAISAALGTVRTPATALYTLVVIIAGLPFGGLGTLIAVIISALAVLGLVIAENSGMLPRPDYAVTLVQ